MLEQSRDTRALGSSFWIVVYCGFCLLAAMVLLQNGCCDAFLMGRHNHRFFPTQVYRVLSQPPSATSAPRFLPLLYEALGGIDVSDDEVDAVPHVVHPLISDDADDNSSSSNDSLSLDTWYDDALDFDGVDPSDDEVCAFSSSLGLSLGQGKAVVEIPNMASEAECNILLEAALLACERRNDSSAAGRSRFSVSDPTAFDSSIVVTLCDEILLRVLDHVDEYIHSIYTDLFVPPMDVHKPEEKWLKNQPLNAQLEEVSVAPSFEILRDTSDGLRDLYMRGELEWSEGEPAINIYQAGGGFGSHKDHLALTVLIPLTGSDCFGGGGTGFWAGNRKVDENQRDTSPTKILKPQPGSALIFGGDVTHAGMPVSEGIRSVFVCSFSTRTAASSADRLHGMQAPPQISPSFQKGSM